MAVVGIEDSSLQADSCPQVSRLGLSWLMNCVNDCAWCSKEASVKDCPAFQCCHQCFSTVGWASRGVGNINRTVSVLQYCVPL